jgi:DNA-binding transcriptional LysR family regulator
MKRAPSSLLPPRQLQAIAAVAETGSMHAAARTLGVPQPALSRLVAGAERLLGSTLFERSRSGTRPTEAGARVIKQAAFALQALEGLSDAARHSLPVVRLGCIPRVMDALVPHLLARLTGGDAGFRLRVAVGTSSELVAELDAGRLDFVIARRMVPKGEDSPLVAERLYDEGTVVVCGVRNTLAPRTACAFTELAGFSWVLPKRGFYSRDALDRMLPRLGLAPIVPIIESSSLGSNLSVVTATTFLTIAPEFAARRFAALKLARIVETRPALGSSPVMLQYHPGQRSHPSFAAFRAAVTAARRLAAAA